MDADTAHDVNAVGKASLDHVVGGPDNLWARPFFETVGGNGEHNSAAAAGAAPSPLMLLAARLQGAVALGRGPAVARSLTTLVLPQGGEWMLRRARPVQVKLLNEVNVALFLCGRLCSHLYFSSAFYCGRLFICGFCNFTSTFFF